MKNLLITAAAMFALGTSANAAGLSIDGGVAGIIPGVSQLSTPENDALAQFGFPATLSGFYLSTIKALEDTNLKFEFFGAEAGADNKVTSYGNVFMHNSQDPGEQDFQFAADLNNPLATFFAAVSAGEVLDFAFESTFNNTTRSVTNGGSNGVLNDNGTPGDTTDDFFTGVNFFASFTNNPEGTTGNSLLLFFDDAGIAGDNHDDFFVRISVVPLPAGLLLMGTALGGLGLVSRRRKKA